MSAARAGVTGGGAGRLTGESAVTVVRALRGARVWLIARRSSSAKPSRPGFCGREALSGLRAVERLGCRRHTALFGQEVGALARDLRARGAQQWRQTRAILHIPRRGEAARVNVTAKPGRSAPTPPILFNPSEQTWRSSRARPVSHTVARSKDGPEPEKVVSRTTPAGIPQGAGRSWGEAPWWRRHARVAAGLSSARGGVPVENGRSPPARQSNCHRARPSHNLDVLCKSHNGGFGPQTAGWPERSH
jgi:hypothetical protein